MCNDSDGELEQTSFNDGNQIKHATPTHVRVSSLMKVVCGALFICAAFIVAAGQSAAGSGQGQGSGASSSGQGTSGQGVTGSNQGTATPGQGQPSTGGPTVPIGQSGSGQAPIGVNGTNRGNQTGQQSVGGQGRSNTSGQVGQGTPGEPSGATSVSNGQTIGASPVDTRNAARTGAAQVMNNAPSQLSLAQAIEFALQNNLATLLAREREQEARGLAREALSNLLPNLTATAFQSNRTINLRSQGIAIPFAPSFVGPFNTFDARLNLAQSIFDLSALRRYQASRAGIDIARLQEPLARQQVATGVTLAYVEVLRADEQARAAQANLELAQSLLRLAEDQRTAGVATGVDMARAATRVAQEVVNLTQAQTAAEQARLALQRIVGLPQGSPLTLVDMLQFTRQDVPPIEQALTTSRENRYELRLAEAQLRQTSLARRAVRAEQLPSFGLAGDYGLSGVTPTNTDLPTRSLAVRLSFPIFNGGLTRARLGVATSQERQAELQLGDVRGQVEEDVRLALVTINTTSAQVTAAEQTLQLAQRELQLARDRFTAGVGDNVEVLNAQTSLENARLVRVAALAAYNFARVNLAAALGQAEAFRL